MSECGPRDIPLLEAGVYKNSNKLAESRGEPNDVIMSPVSCRRRSSKISTLHSFLLYLPDDGHACRDCLSVILYICGYITCLWKASGMVNVLEIQQNVLTTCVGTLGKRREERARVRGKLKKRRQSRSQSVIVVEYYCLLLPPRLVCT